MEVEWNTADTGIGNEGTMCIFSDGVWEYLGVMGYYGLEGALYFVHTSTSDPRFNHSSLIAVFTFSLSMRGVESAIIW